MRQPAFAQPETLTFLGEPDPDTGPGGQPQHSDAGHALLAGHALPLLGRADIVVDDHPVRTQRQTGGRLHGRRH